jgi:predicted cobalt transporter CbtA
MDITLMMLGMAAIEKTSSRGKELMAWTLLGFAATVLAVLLGLIVRGLM